MIERHLAIGRVLGYGNKNGYSPLYFSLHMFLFFFFFRWFAGVLRWLGWRVFVAGLRWRCGEGRLVRAGRVGWVVDGVVGARW